MVLFFSIGIALAQVPSFRSPVQLQANGSLLDVGLMAEPCVVDWDGDGINDLLVGQFSPGKVRFYPNSGTNANPVYTTYSFLQADGADIQVSAG
jgi:hypothetical protein